MYKITLPEAGPKRLYFEVHIKYVHNILTFLGLPCTLSGKTDDNAFVLQVNETPILIDFSNFLPLVRDPAKYPFYFKFQYCSSTHQKFSNVFSFTKVSFQFWERFYQLSDKIKYSGESNVILNMQLVHQGARERRDFVQKMLKAKYGSGVVTNVVLDQVEYWNRINNCLVHVFVPGARNDILDRGHIQYLAFGCCTIAPPIVDELSFNQKLIPGKHYVCCKPDYSDLIDKIEWCKRNRKKCRIIGANAKKLFWETSVPEKMWEWVRKCTGIE